jgi:D-3-phosphoglycerate dehydrogenase / 2-oxoglutarate reductase
VRRVLADPSFRREQVQADLAGLGVVVETGSPPWTGDDVVGLLSFEPVTAPDLAALPSLRVVATPSVGVDHIDVAAATERGVRVCNVPDYCVEEMADHTVALLLALARGVVELDRSVRHGGWDHLAAGPLGRLADIRLGIVGYGRIGKAAAARARALGMEVAAFDPLLDPDVISSTGARPMSLDQLLRWSTAISVHAPLTPDTRHLVGARELALLPEGAYVVNVARSGLVDSDALLAALASGHLGGVAIDVLDVEPPDDAAPAPQAPRLVVNPHAGWYSEEAEEAAPRRATESVRDVLEGRVPARAVNEVASSVP